jgi:hypothetical protein
LKIKQFKDVKISNNTIKILFHSYTSINLGSDALFHKFELFKKEDHSKNKNKLINLGIYPKNYNNESNKKEQDNLIINNKTSKNTKKNDIKDNYSNNYRTENKKMVNQFNEKEKNLKNIKEERNYSIKSLRPFPPKLPQLYNYEYKINNKKAFSKDNETLALLNIGNIPNVFYNHLMINKRSSLFFSKYRYNRILMKKRNKNKLLSIIYYYP